MVNMIISGQKTENECAKPRNNPCASDQHASSHASVFYLFYLKSCPHSDTQ